MFSRLSLSFALIFTYVIRLWIVSVTLSMFGISMGLVSWRVGFLVTIGFSEVLGSADLALLMVLVGLGCFLFLWSWRFRVVES